MPDPLHPSTLPSSKPEKQETVIGGTETINATYKKRNAAQNFVIATIILQEKNSSSKYEKEIVKPQTICLNPIHIKSTENMSGQASLNFQKPSFLTKLRSFRIRIPSFGGFFNFKKMSDKQPGRPMKYPYTFTAKIAQFPYKYYINNNWMWKYYLIAAAVSFPIFYKLSRASNSPENVKVWEEIRKRDFTPGGHH